MKNGRRDPFAQTRREMRQERLTRERENMPPDVLEARMAKIIRAKLADNEPISLDDFRLANLPVKEAQACFKRVLRSVQNSLVLDRK